MINKFSFLNVAKYFSSWIFQKHFKCFSGVRINSCKSNENLFQSDSNFAQTFIDHHVLEYINFNGHCITKYNISIPKKVINLYISDTLGPKLRNLNTNFTLGSFLVIIWICKDN